LIQPSMVRRPFIQHMNRRLSKYAKCANENSSAHFLAHFLAHF